jgi:hypothetical protein
MSGLKTSSSQVLTHSHHLRAYVRKIFVEGNPYRLLVVMVALASHLVLPASAAVWYVDKDATGSNNGTSWANAWRTFASVVWGTSGVKAGDTLYISGGSTTKTYTEGLVVGASGSAGSVIRIAIDAANPSHNGVVVFNGVAISMARNYIWLDGNVGGTPHLAINNVAGDCVTAGSTTGVEISYVSSTNCSGFANVGSASNARIRNCAISGSYGVRTFYALGSGTWDRIQIYSNFVGRVVSSTGGPDGFWAGNGVSIWANTFRVDSTTSATSDEHPDSVQVNGDFIKIYRNDFINVGDSIIDVGGYSGRDSVYVFNNVIRITQDVDSYPEFFRFYNGTPAYVNNIKIINNTFVDQRTSSGWFTVGFRNYNGNPTGVGNEIKNNIFVNCAALLIHPSTGFTSNSFAFGGNVYPSNFGIEFWGTTYTPASWVASRDSGGKVGQPAFVSYTTKSVNNDFHLLSSDTVARNTGVNMSALFNTDKDGNPRPATGSWDAGAYQFSSGGGNLPPTVSAGSDLTITLPTNSISVNGSASDPEGGTLTKLWSVVSGPGSVVFSSPSSTVTTATFSTNAGVYTLRLTVSDGVNTSSDDVLVTVNSASQPGSVFLEAESGTITAPFSVSAGIVSQAVDTGVADGGRAVYLFNVPTAGSYVILAWVNGSGLAANSLFINVDAEPTDPYMIWDILPLTVGVEPRFVAWRGNTGTSEGDEFNPKVFTLAAGQHSLIIVGREAGTGLDRFEIRKVTLPIPPQNLRVVAP